MAAVDFARNNGMPLAVRGGAHSVPGYGTCDGGVVADLTGMRGVRVDPVRRTARVEGGATLGDLNAATYPFGLAVTGGIISTTGVGGITLGGGIGYLARKLGLTCDNLLSADVVTADGRAAGRQREGGAGPLLGPARRQRKLRRGHLLRVRAEPGEGRLRRSDALRTGTRRGRPEALPRIHRGGPGGPRRLPRLPDRPAAAVHPGGPARRHLRPRGGLLGGPDGGGRGGDPADARGRAEGRGDGRPDAVPGDQQRLRPAGAAGPAALLEGRLLDRAHRRRDRRPPGARAEGAGRELHDAHLLDQRGLPSDGTGGHRLRPPRGHLRHRDRRHVARPGRERRQHRLGARLLRRRRPALRGSGYVNFMADDDQHRAADNYGSSYPRLVEVKRAYDPGNLFRVNHNIKP
ncbi:FAD-dependent oxidoreductase [Kitasatospora arboriphila]